MSKLLSGVRNSCDMFAKNSDLYFDVSASCLAFSSKRLPGLLHFAVLAFHFDVLMREQPGLFLELLIRLLQFLLTILQFHGQRLRLLEQVFRPHVGRDRVEHDADAFGELLEQRLMRRAELLERCQLEHGLHLTFEQHRQHDDAARRRAAQSGARPACNRPAHWSAESARARRRTGRPALRPA